MAKRNIVLEGSEILQKKCREVTDFGEKTAQLVDDMFETLAATPNGVGLAAPQVGILKRIIVIEIDEEKYELINPVITAFSGSQIGTEGCLSCPGEFGDVDRAMNVTVEYFDRTGKKHKIDAEEFFARVLQHEIDHLEGILFKAKAIYMLEPEERQK